MTAAAASTNNSLGHLSMMQLQELQGVIKNPIQGRQVMIPLTSQAFVIGSLQPNIQNGEEILLLRQQKQSDKATMKGIDESDLKEMTRQEIHDLLEVEKQRKKKAAIESKKSKTNKKNTIKTTPVSQSATSSPNNTTAKATPSQTQTHATSRKNSGTTTDSNNTPTLSFFEIKEELDGTGNVVTGQAINVTKQLELLEKQRQEESKREEKDESKQDFADYPEPTEEYDSPPDHPDELSTTPATVTDDDYQALSARLDELARLEEEAEANSTNNRKSSKKLQGAWSKGFLGGGRKNTNPKAAGNITARSRYYEPTSEDESHQQQSATSAAAVEPSVVVERPIPSKQPPASSTTIPNDITSPTSTLRTTETVDMPKGKKKSGWSKGFLNNASKSNKGKPKEVPTTSQQQPQLKKEDQDQAKKVSFQLGAQEVREIPRIGNTSVASIRNTNKMNTRPIFPEASEPPREQVNDGKGDDDDRDKAPSPSTMTATASRPFDSTVFSGVVKERPIGMSTNAATAPSSQPQQESKPAKKLSKFAQDRMMATASAPSPQQQQQSQPKKLSKFAQERMMMQNR